MMRILPKISPGNLGVKGDMGRTWELSNSIATKFSRGVCTEAEGCATMSGDEQSWFGFSIEDANARYAVVRERRSDFRGRAGRDRGWAPDNTNLRGDQ
jgi:hypothetical protein